MSSTEYYPDSGFRPLTPAQVEKVLHVVGNALATVDPLGRCERVEGPCQACYEHEKRARQAIEQIKALGRV